MVILQRAFFILLLSACLALSQSVNLSNSQALKIGTRIWKNECAGTIDGLTSWNSGEDFASLGIAHFIWYPQGKRGPFEESFPKLLRFMSSSGAKVPQWLLEAKACPWTTRKEFLTEFKGERLTSLRIFLKETVAIQARFAALRLEQSLPKMLSAAGAGQQEKIKANFYRVAAEPMGLYALMDYVNFKGEGTSASERYNGQGWGLLQVLETMPSSGPALSGFAKAADSVLTRRVQNSPPARNEAQWLPGWRNRLTTYTN